LLVLSNEDEDEDKTYKELCSRLEATPMGRVKDLEIAFVKDSNLKRNVMKKAEAPKVGLLEQAERKMIDLVLGTSSSSAPQKTEISYPEYVLFKKNNPDAGIRFVGGPEKGADGDDEDSEAKTMANAVSTFLSDQLHTKKIGSYVYALGSYDMVAAQVMKYDTGSWKQKLWALGVAQVLRSMFVRYTIAGFFSSTTPVMEFEKELIDTYIKIGYKVVEHGKNYPEDQIKRLEDMLENDQSSISEMKKEKLNQRVYTLKRFSEPETFSDKEVMSFLVKVGMNVFTIMLLLVMVPMTMMASPEDEEEEEKKEEESKEEEKEGEDTVGAELEDPDKDDDEGSEPGTPLLTKQEKRALAIQRAKESMKEDKENVQRVLRSRKGAK